MFTFLKSNLSSKIFFIYNTKIVLYFMNNFRRAMDFKEFLFIRFIVIGVIVSSCGNRSAGSNLISEEDLDQLLNV